MPLRLLAGPIGSGKTTCLLDRFKQFSPAECVSSVRLVTPNLSHARYLRRLLLSDPAFPGFLGEPILSLQAFALEIIRRSGQTGPSIITDSTRRSLMREMHYPTCFDAVCSSLGFLDALARTLCMLKQTGMRPDDLRVAVESASDLPSFSREKLVGVAEVYSAYQSALMASGSCESTDFLHLSLAGSPPFRVVLFDGFTRLGPVEQEFIAALAGVCDVVVAVDCDSEETGRFPQAESAIRFFSQLPGASIERMPSKRENSSITHLSRSIFTTSATPIKPDDTVMVFKADDRQLEAEMVAREIKRLSRAGFTHDEIAVACRGSQERMRISRVMQQYGVPIANEYLPLSSSFLSVRVMRLLDEGMAAESALNTATDEVLPPADERSLREYNGALRAIGRILDGMPDNAPNDLKEMIASRDYRLPGTSDCGIVLASPSGLVGRSFRAVFVTGLRDGLFPRLPFEDPLFTYRERAALNHVLPHTLPLFSDEEQSERTAFVTCIGSARECLYLCGDVESAFLSCAEQVFSRPVPMWELRVGDILTMLPVAETQQEITARTVYDLATSDDLSAATAYNELISAGALHPDLFRWLGKDYSRSLPAYLRVPVDRPEVSE